MFGIDKTSEDRLVPPQIFRFYFVPLLGGRWEGKNPFSREFEHLIAVDRAECGLNRIRRLESKSRGVRHGTGK